MQPLLPENIKNEILRNYIEYQKLFVEFQSKFLTGLYSRYQSLENGNVVLYFAKQTQQDILRQKDYDLNFNISLPKFWENHRGTKLKQNSIVKIAKTIYLPKETARRKILQLTKQKVLNKINRDIGWLPDKQYKQNYNLFINEEIDNVSRLISFISKKLNYSISSQEVSKEIKEKFSFYWFHYLESQLEYLRLWSKQVHDLELVLIFLQVAHLFTSKVKKNISHSDLYNDPNLIKELMSASISATSISDVTGIPKATCVRKLEILINLKIVSQDNISRGYYLIPEAIQEKMVSRSITEKVINIFSNFFFICLRAIKTKI